MSGSFEPQGSVETLYIVTGFRYFGERLGETGPSVLVGLAMLSQFGCGHFSFWVCFPSRMFVVVLSFVKYPVLQWRRLSL